MLEVRYAQQPAEAPLQLTLDVSLQAVPSVEAEANSKSLTLYVLQPWLPLAYAGRPHANTGLVLAEEAVSLVHSGEGSAEVQYAGVSTLHGAKGRTLPPSAVRVQGFRPFTFAGSDAEHIKVVVSGESLRAGEYNGTLLLRVLHQAAPVLISLKVLVKHGPSLALIVLVLGLVAALLFGWWNDAGKGRQDTARAVQRVERHIRTGMRLQAQERDAAIALLREAVDLLNAREPWQDAQKKVEAAEKFITDTRTKADGVIKAVEALAQQVNGLRPGRRVREELTAKLTSLREGIIQGKYTSLDEAQRLLDDLTEKVTTLREFLGKFAQLPPEKQTQITQAMDDAPALPQMLSILRDAGADVRPEPGRSYTLEAEPVPAVAASDRLELSQDLSLQLTLGRLAVTVITYVFALVVGWVALYVASDTFGADPKDYVSLFLWGAAIESVRGQVVTLTSLQMTFQEKVTP
jgi:hypothetical protein